MILDRPFQQHGFSELDFQPLRRQTGTPQRGLDDIKQLDLLELDRGQVHRDLEVCRPGRRVVARSPEHPFTKRDDESGLLSEPDELVGRYQPPGRMTPANKSFQATPLAGLDVEEWLIMQFELTACDGVPQIALQRVSGFQFRS